MSAAPPPPGRTHCYILDLDRVLPGDILLTRSRLQFFSPSTLKSFGIRKLAGGNFSHAAICIEYGLFVEAIGAGVCRLAVSQTAVKSKDNVKLLRLKPNAPDASSTAKRAADFAHEYLSRGYSYRAAVGVLFSKLRDAERDAMFCSQLVARAYAQSGLPLLGDKSPEATAPGHLPDSLFLEDVTTQALGRVDGFDQDYCEDEGQ